MPLRRAISRKERVVVSTRTCIAARVSDGCLNVNRIVDLARRRRRVFQNETAPRGRREAVSDERGRASDDPLVRRPWRETIAGAEPATVDPAALRQRPCLIADQRNAVKMIILGTFINRTHLQARLNAWKRLACMEKSGAVRPQIW